MLSIDEIIDIISTSTETTPLGEPQTYLDLSSGRSIEVTNERDDYGDSFYSLRLHASSDEFDADGTDIIKTIVTDTNDVRDAAFTAQCLADAYDDDIIG